jgi:RNA 3'-terminal phosphate cyclase (ATP)
VIDIDGSFGEGGGQILRTSLALSMLTGKPFAMRNIRANRAKPGLRRQHSTCVDVARELCGATVHGNAVGSSYLEFTPGPIIGGESDDSSGSEMMPIERVVDIGSMGSTTLVVQTVLVPLLAAGRAITLVIRGGTHNPMAPPFEFLDRVFLPCLRAMGANVELTLDVHGFVSGPGDRQGQIGQLTLRVQPSVPIREGGPRLRATDFVHSHSIRKRRATVLTSKLPTHVAERELAVIRERLGFDKTECEIHEVHDAGIGNAVMIELERGMANDLAIRELITVLGEKGVRAELVASRACDQVDAYLAVDSPVAPVGEHLADQLLLPFAVWPGASFRTGPLSLHATTNIATIGKFLDVPIIVEREGNATRVTVAYGFPGNRTLHP